MARSPTCRNVSGELPANRSQAGLSRPSLGYRPFAYPVAVSLSQSEPAFSFWM